MTAADTSAEEVEWLARWHDAKCGAWRSDGGNSGLALKHADTAATLRALLAEREAEAASGFAMAATQCEAPVMDEWGHLGCATITKLTADLATLRASIPEAQTRAWCAGRDRAVAAVRMQDAWDGHNDYCDSCKGGAIWPDRDDVATAIAALPPPDFEMETGK